MLIKGFFQRICFLWLFISLFNGVIVNANGLPFEYQFQHLSREQGLSQGTAYAINQDKLGFMWFGTQEGLNRFDGRRVKIYSRSNAPFSLVDSYINLIVNDPTDPELMWLGTHAGLQSFNHRSGQFKLYNGKHDEPISDQQIYAIEFVNSQFVWLGTDFGLNYFDYKNNINSIHMLSYSGIEQQRLNGIYSVVALGDEFLLLATRAGLFKYSHLKRKIVKKIALEDSPLVWKIFKDNQANVWVGTKKGLYKIDQGENLSYVNLPELELEPTDKNIYSFYQSTDKTIWIGSGNGVYFKKIDQQIFTLLKHNPNNKSSLVNNTIWSIFEDNTGIMWFGTDVAISRFNPNTLDFHTLTKRDDNSALPDKWLFSIHKNNLNPLWVGTVGGIAGFDNFGIRQFHFHRGNGLSHSWTYGLYQQNDQTLWAGTYEGLNKINLLDGRIEFVPLKNSFASSHIWGLMGDDSGLWIAADDGLSFLDFETNKFTHWNKGSALDKGLTDERIYSLHKDKVGTVWVGTSHGLNKLINPGKKNAEIVHYLPDDKVAGTLSNNWVTDISSDSYNRIWVSTDAGLNLFFPNQNKFIQIDKFSQTQEHIYAVEVDDDDRIWFSSNSGIGRLDYSGDNSEKFNLDKLSLKNYTKNDGLQANEFNEFASFKDDKGNIYFGGVNGLNMISPAAFYSRQENFPRAVISQLDINGIPVKPRWQNSDSPIAEEVIWSQAINLNYQQNFLTFYLSALEFSDPINNQIEYRLLGSDKNWQATVDKQPFVSFHQLTPGDYELQVRVATPRSGWNPEITSLKISISPPFWLTWQAYYFYLFSFCSIIYFFFQRNKKRLKRLEDIVKREQSVAARLKEVDIIKDQFLANTSHELRTPLNGIIGLSNYLIEENINNIPKPEVDEILKLIQTSGIRMNELVEDILQASLLNRGQLKLQFARVDLFLIANECVRELTISKNIKDIKLYNNIPQNFICAKADPSRVKQIILNLMSNSLKFTDKGKIEVNAVELEGFVKISITDTGIGIDKQHHARIFETFEQVDASPNRKFDGSGLGLAIVKQLVELHGGQVSIQSSLNLGTSISFTLNKDTD